ncbi:MAG: hypothetical protein H0V18_13875 [Pyrinomonadaceae bacterium]|nr:hypothetical protein [Pyrinomonadaceae bacterium]
MAEVERAKRILEAERETVLTGLLKARAADRDLARKRRRVRERIEAFLLRGKAAGVEVTEMAGALGITRQMAHRLIKEAEKNA